MLLTIVVLGVFPGEHDVWQTVIASGPSCLGAGYFHIAVAPVGLVVLERRGYIVPERSSN